MELEITWGRILKVWWAFLWRNLLAIIAATLVSGVIGAIAGFVIAATGGTVERLEIYFQLFGFVVGLAASIVPIGLILGKDFGEFRLALVRTEEAVPESTMSIAEASPDL